MISKLEYPAGGLRRVQSRKCNRPENVLTERQTTDRPCRSCVSHGLYLIRWLGIGGRILLFAQELLVSVAWQPTLPPVVLANLASRQRRRAVQSRAWASVVRKSLSGSVEVLPASWPSSSGSNPSGLSPLRCRPLPD